MNYEVSGTGDPDTGELDCDRLWEGHSLCVPNVLYNEVTSNCTYIKKRWQILTMIFSGSQEEGWSEVVTAVKPNHGQKLCRLKSLHSKQSLSTATL